MWPCNQGRSHVWQRFGRWRIRIFFCSFGCQSLSRPWLKASTSRDYYRRQWRGHDVSFFNYLLFTVTIYSTTLLPTKMRWATLTSSSAWMLVVITKRHWRSQRRLEAASILICRSKLRVTIFIQELEVAWCPSPTRSSARCLCEFRTWRPRTWIRCSTLKYQIMPVKVYKIWLDLNQKLQGVLWMAVCIHAVINITVSLTEKRNMKYFSTLHGDLS